MSRLDGLNYYNDSRVRALQKGDWYKSFDERAMTVEIQITRWDEEDEEVEEVVTMPVRFKVCDLCGGKGKHVNPSIDCGGLSRDDFDYDPDFEEDYMRGRYDVSCYQCRGARVMLALPDYSVLTEEEKEVVDYLDEIANDDARHHAMCMAELRMGC